MFLIFHLGRPDVLSTGDLGIRRAAQLAYGLDELPEPGGAGADRRALAPAPHARLPLPVAFARQRSAVMARFRDMRRTIVILVALALAAVALTATGCGDDDGGDETSTGSDQSLSKEEFIAQGDQICTEGDAKIDAEGSQPQFAGRPGQVVQLVRQVIVPGMRAQLQQLRELPPPEGDEAEIQAMLDAFEQGIDELEANPRQLAGAPPSTGSPRRACCSATTASCPATAGPDHSRDELMAALERISIAAIGDSAEDLAEQGGQPRRPGSTASGRRSCFAAPSPRRPGWPRRPRRWGSGRGSPGPSRAAPSSSRSRRSTSTRCRAGASGSASARG